MKTIDQHYKEITMPTENTCVHMVYGENMKKEVADGHVTILHTVDTNSKSIINAHMECGNLYTPSKDSLKDTVFKLSDEEAQKKLAAPCKN